MTILVPFRTVRILDPFRTVTILDPARVGRRDSAQGDTIRVTATLAILLPFGIAFGEWLHGRVDERRFKLGVAVLLLLSGAALLA